MITGAIRGKAWLEDEPNVVVFRGKDLHGSKTCKRISIFQDVKHILVLISA